MNINPPYVEICTFSKGLALIPKKHRQPGHTFFSHPSGFTLWKNQLLEVPSKDLHRITSQMFIN